MEDDCSNKKIKYRNESFKSVKLFMADVASLEAVYSNLELHFCNIGRFSDEDDVDIVVNKRMNK